jgi:hypothetical protein
MSSEIESPERPPPYKRLWLHIVDLASSFNPFIDAAKKSWVWIAKEIKEGASELRNRRLHRIGASPATSN